MGDPHPSPESLVPAGWVYRIDLRDHPAIRRPPAGAGRGAWKRATKQELTSWNIRQVVIQINLKRTTVWIRGDTQPSISAQPGARGVHGLPLTRTLTGIETSARKKDSNARTRNACKYRHNSADLAVYES
ncbi:hypothetical protein NDU88_002203 [Pleurodeles waltl]|uniref:Uncharacterized protein n=1 Tax=Pleurodeles waltl TaxID=8319 RepID=A0AAV7UWF4_PLEWA|nr:hypothetical protein NDU88_002203 [Pleurodeles waltl]